MTFKEQKKEIFDNFDWAKVRKTMKFLNWKWSSCNAVPSIKELKECAEKLLTSLYTDKWLKKSKTCLNSTGGFEVRKENGRLSLSFVVEDWDMGSYE